MKTGIYWQDPKYALRPGRDFIFDPSLVLYLPLGKLDGASFMSKEARGYLCTVTGALWRPDGRDFDGTDDRIAIPAAASLTFNGTISVELWINPDDVTGDKTFIHGSITESYGLSWWIEKVGAWLLCSINGVYDYQSFAAVFVVGTWIHIVMTYDKAAGDGKEIKGYVNGVLHTWKTYTNDVADENGIAIGEVGNGGFDFDGKIGEVRIYNRALSALEIQRNHLATKWRYQ